LLSSFTFYDNQRLQQVWPQFKEGHEVLAESD
jgi:hypothetical protein